MDSLYSVQIIAWMWIALGAAGLIGYAILVLGSSARNATDWWVSLLVLGIGFGGGSLFALGIAAAGWPSIGLYSWRTAGIIVTGLAIVLAIRIRPLVSSSGPPGTKPTSRATYGRWSAVIGSILLAALTWLSFQIDSLPNSANPLADSAAPNAPTSISTDLWSTTWSGTLILLAAGTVIFLVLFAQRVGRGGAPKIETHWEGIGGGVGGWRMSSSLGYLLVAGVLALLFTVFLFRFDARERERDLSGRPTPAPTPATAAR
jgi:hypothetical protein